MKPIQYKKHTLKSSLQLSLLLLLGCFSLSVSADVTHPEGATLATYGTAVTTFCFSTVSDPTCVTQPDLGALDPLSNGSICAGVIGGQTALGTTTQTVINSLTYDTNTNTPTGGNFCPFLDSSGLFWAIDLTNLSEAGITPCSSTDLFSSDLGCRAPVAPVAYNIPIFGPFGLLAVLLGLMWFGNRQRKD